MAPMRGKDPVLGSTRRLSTWLKRRSSSSDQMSEGLKYWGGLFQLGKVAPPHQMSDTVKKRPAGTLSDFMEHTFWTRVGKLDWFIQVEILSFGLWTQQDVITQVNWYYGDSLPAYLK